jgi:hypothetical protein
MPATVSCAALLAVAGLGDLALTAAHVAAVPYLAVVSLLGGVAYILALRICFPDSLRSVRSFVRQLMPGNPLRGVRRPLAPANTQ